MKSLLFASLMLIIVGCSRESSNNPSPNKDARNIVASSIETNGFEKIDGCYDLLNGRLDGVLYSVEIKSEPDSCDGSSAGKTSFIVTTSENGNQQTSTWFDMYILKDGGQFTETDNLLKYKYSGVDHSECELKKDMILVESLSFESQDDGIVNVNWSGMHCDPKMSYSKCESLGAVWKWQLKKSENCLPK